MGDLGLPPDWVARAALVGAIVWLAAALSPRARANCRHFVERHPFGIVAALAATAALGSLGYVGYYLRGGSRIVDATAYWQQARAFAAGHWTLPLVEPTAALRGRFLYFDSVRHTLGVLFPPGYAALLAVGFLLGTPLAIGAFIAALLVVASGYLAWRLFESKHAAVLAALFSATTATLRYHTADTMSHGLSALLVTTAIAATLGRGIASSALAGLSIGWLLATRPVTGATLLLVCLTYRVVAAREPRWFMTFAAGLVPGCALWFAYQWATTGSPWASTQFAYYAVADGPPGCFRYGFGKGIGCLFEHGTYVQRRLPNGYGILEAAHITLLRLRWHCLDVHNFEPLILAPIIAARHALARRESRLLVGAIAMVMLAYAPFYFDASYPGGGARLFVDVIPLEQVLVAGWLVNSRWFTWFLPLSLAGFAGHGAFEHLKLRDRDGGRPMFEPRVLAAAGIRSGLVFVETDHGFFLGHDPWIHDPKTGVIVLRHHGDAHDRIAWEALGHPKAYRYAFDPTVPGAAARVLALDPRDLSSRVRFEAEAEWPPLSVESGWVRPLYPPNDCTSGRRGLALEPVAGRASATLSLYAKQSGTARLTVGFVARQSGQQRISVTLGQQIHKLSQSALIHQCFSASFADVPVGHGEQPMRIETAGSGVIVDYWIVD